MRPGNPQLDEAQDAGDRRYTMRARLGGKDVTDQVESWSVDRSWESGLPDQVAASTGAASAQAKLSLSGDGTQTAASLYSPWAPRASADVTRPGQSAVLHWGLADQDLQTFRGRVRKVDADAGSGSASVTSLDGAEVLRGPAVLPPVTLSGGVSVPWCIDHAVRSAGFNESPPERPNSILFASMNRGVAANRGMLTSWASVSGPERDLSPWTAGPITGSANPWTIEYAPQRRVISQVNNLLVDWWLLAGPSTDASSVSLMFRSGESGAGSSFRVQLDPQSWLLDISAAGALRQISVPAQYRAEGRVKVTFQLTLRTLGNPTTLRVWVSTPAGQYVTEEITGGAPDFGWLHTITASSRTPIECLNVSRLLGSQPVLPEWSRTAEILTDGDDNDYLMDASPDVSGSWWSMLKSIADDHLLYLGFDEDGFFHARAREYMSPDSAPPVDLEVTSARELSEVQVSEEMDAVANILQGSVPSYTAEDMEDWWHGAVETIPAGGQLHFTIPETARAWGVACPQPFAAAGGGTADTSRVKFYSSNGGYAPVEVELFHESGLSITYYNRGSLPARVSTTSGGSTGSLWLAREDVRSVDMYPTELRSPSSIAVYGPQVLDLGSSPWVQRQRTLIPLLQALMEWTRSPIPLNDAISVLPDPRVQLGDVVRIVDRTGSHLDGVFRVIGIDVSGSGPEVRMRLSVRPAYRPAAPSDAGLTVEPITDPAAADIFAG